MRRSIVILFFLTIHHFGVSQTITFSGKNVALKIVFAAIKQQTGYMVSGNVDLLKNANSVSLEARNMPLFDVLDIVLKDQRFNYRINKKTIILIKKNTTPATADLNSAAANPDTFRRINIYGRIINEAGEPVVATITIKGTKMAASTNANGEFVFKEVPENGTLVIGSINIQTAEVKVNGNVDLKNIIVKTKIKEEETVVIANTGYQKLKPNEITGSVTVVDNKTLNQQTGTNIIDRLNGVTPGMLFNVGKKNFDGSSNLYSIRGLSTIEGNTSPLIILDNFQYDGDINNINPSNIDNITILKDAAAASIYGALGGNGVIVITTKKSRFNQKLQVGFNTNMIITQKPDLYVIPEMSSADYVELEEDLFNKAVDFGSNTNDYAPITPVISLLMQRRADRISAIDSALRIDALKKFDYRDDLNKYFYQPAITRQYSLSLNGGGNNISWLISGAYDKKISNLDAKDDKINVRFNNNYRPVKNMELSFSAYYTNASTQSGKTIPLRTRNAPYIKFADENGTPLDITRAYRTEYTDTAGARHLLNWKYYPLEDYKHDKTTTRREQIIANVEAKYQLLKGLDLNLSYQYQREWSSSERYADIESYYARNAINRFTKLSRTSLPDTLRIPIGGVLDAGTSSQHSQNLRAQLNFQKKWNEHALSIMTAAEGRELITDPTGTYSLYGYNEDPLTQGRVDFNSEYPLFINGAPATINGAPRASSTLTKEFVSFLGNLAYTYQQRYSFSASARRDASNIFGLNTNDKWTPLWSVGVGWEISRERFYLIKSLPYLKLRITWGYSGNVDPAKTASTILTYSNGFLGPDGAPFAGASRKNPDLRWEKSRQLNAGIDFAVKNRAVTGSIEYYQKKGTDLYGQMFYDYTTYGYTETIPANVADMKGSGIDVTIQTKNIDQLFKWNTHFIFNYTTNITTNYLSRAALTGSTLVDDGSIITPVIGKPLYAIAAFRWGGLDASGNPRGYLNDTLSTNYGGILLQQDQKGISSSSIVYIGSSNPTYFGSLINEFNWKHFSVNINIAYRFGYYFRKPVFSQSAWISSATGYSGDYARRWQRQGDELITNVPAFIYPVPLGMDMDGRGIFYSKSSINVLRGDHVRLQYINLIYSFTPRHKKFLFDNIQVYGNAANLGILWRANKEKIDPDYPSSIPPSKSYTIGVRASL